jgi:hypothetical protein
MQTPPENCGQIYVCQRFLGSIRCINALTKEEYDKGEERYPFVVDYWQPEGYWGSPRLCIGGRYEGYFTPPRWGWSIGGHPPDTTEPVLVHLRQRYAGTFYSPERGYYLGKCQKTESGQSEWRVSLDALTGRVPQGRDWLRVPRSLVSWVAMPVSGSSTRPTV